MSIEASRDVGSLSDDKGQKMNTSLHSMTTSQSHNSLLENSYQESHSSMSASLLSIDTSQGPIPQLHFGITNETESKAGPERGSDSTKNKRRAKPYDKEPTQKSDASKSKTSKRAYKRYPKPPYSYLGMVVTAIANSYDQRLSLAEIQDALGEFFPFFRDEYTGWKDSIRHTLSLNNCFYKVETLVGKKKKIFYWCVDLAKVPVDTFRRQENAMGQSGEYNALLHEQLNLPQVKLPSRIKRNVVIEDSLEEASVSTASEPGQDYIELMKTEPCTPTQLSCSEETQSSQQENIDHRIEKLLTFKLPPCSKIETESPDRIRGNDVTDAASFLGADETSNLFSPQSDFNCQGDHYRDTDNRQGDHYRDTDNRQGDHYRDTDNRQGDHYRDTDNRQGDHYRDAYNRQGDHNRDAATMDGIVALLSLNKHGNVVTMEAAENLSLLCYTPMSSHPVFQPEPVPAQPYHGIPSLDIDTNAVTSPSPSSSSTSPTSDVHIRDCPSRASTTPDYGIGIPECDQPQDVKSYGQQQLNNGVDEFIAYNGYYTINKAGSFAYPISLPPPSHPSRANQQMSSLEYKAPASFYAMMASQVYGSSPELE